MDRGARIAHCAYPAFGAGVVILFKPCEQGGSGLSSAGAGRSSFVHCRHLAKNKLDASRAANLTAGPQENELSLS